MATNYKERLKNVAHRMRASRDEGEEMLAGGVTAFGIGWLESSGRMAQVPQVFGLPRTVTLAGIAYLAERFGSGTIANVAAGAKNASASIAIYQYAKGMDVSGAVPYGEEGVEGRRRRRHSSVASGAERLEREIERRRALESGGGRDAELDALEREVPAE